MAAGNSFGAAARLKTRGGEVTIYRLQKLIETNGLSGETLQMLNESKIQFVVVPLFGLPQATTPGAGSIVLETVFSDSTGMVILELRRRE